MIKKSSTNEFSSAFIIPHFINGFEEQKGKMFIAETIEGLFSQTDDDWSAIIVVDMPPDKEINDYLSHLKRKYYPKIDIIFLERNVGLGVSRNVGILRALERGHSIILFNDSDDVSHPKRLEVVKKI